jgi:hypothetical protein
MMMIVEEKRLVVMEDNEWSHGEDGVRNKDGGCQVKNGDTKNL